MDIPASKVHLPSFGCCGVDNGDVMGTSVFCLPILNLLHDKICLRRHCTMEPSSEHVASAELDQKVVVLCDICHSSHATVV